MSLPVAILAGGLSTRLRPITETIPKALVEVAGRPFIEHQLALLRDHGLTDILLLVGHLGEMLRDALDDGSSRGVRIRYVFDGARQLGTGGAVRNALSELGTTFFVLYGDSYLPCDYTRVENVFVASGKSGLMTVCRNNNRWDASNVLFADGRICQYDKRHRTADMQHIDYGLGAFMSTAFDAFPEREPFDLAAVYQRLLATGDLGGFEVNGRFHEIGSPAGLHETRAYLSAQRSFGD